VEKMIEIRYAGVVVGRVSALRELDGEGLFLAIPEPLPVGTPVVLGIEERALAAQVQTVVESPDPARSGMRVRFLEPGVAAHLGVTGAPPGGEAGSGASASPSPPPSASASPSASPSASVAWGAIPGVAAPASGAAATAGAGLVSEPEDSEVGTEPVGTDSGPVFSSEPAGGSSEPSGGGSEPGAPAAAAPPRKNRRNRRR
jgi:hypothetical protein